MMRWPYENIGVVTTRAFRNLLNKIIGDIGADMQEHKDRADNIQAQVDNLVADGDSSTEAAQARVGADGTNYTTLKQRLDTEHGDVTAQLAETGTFPKELGAKLDGSSNDTGYINQAIATGKKLYGYGNAAVTSVEAPYGFDTADTLKIIRQSDGYLYNSYADKYNRLVLGQEYLSYYHRRIASGSSTKIVFSGDSTTENLGLIDGYKINQLIETLATNDGFYNVQTVNRGQSGKTSWDWINNYINDDLALNPDLLVVRWGINDPASGSDLTDFLTNMRTGLQTIRQNKTYAQMSVLLMMPNSTSDYAHGRSEIWYESMVNGLKRLAREFQCCFIDTYAYLQSSRNAYDYMDSAYEGVSSIHPKEIMNIWIADIIYETIFPRALKLLFAQPEPITITAFDAISNPNGLKNGWGSISGFRLPGYWIENNCLHFRGVISGGTV
ncbi:MAG: SGNH/GDSL hydrolase family protein, partial [Bacillus sp. (in: Bacteria)]|nr:SGNH/GDSL hydrolase family protein [Bacillus sp. (in: firmicutes)]